MSHYDERRALWSRTRARVIVSRGSDETANQMAAWAVEDMPRIQSDIWIWIDSYIAHIGARRYNNPPDLNTVRTGANLAATQALADFDNYIGGT